VGTWPQEPRNRRSRMGVQGSRLVEEEGCLEGALEEGVENREEADLGSQQEARLEGRMEADLEDGEEADLGGKQEVGLEGSVEADLGSEQEANLG